MRLSLGCVFAVVFSTAILTVLIPSTSAHITMSNPPAQAGPWSKNPSGQVHTWIGFQGKKFPCGGFPDGPVTKYKAGQVIPVRFWNFGIKNYKRFPPPSGLPQSRHGGGACEFSLSRDGGKTWKVIGQYTKTCPDIYYEWPVMIPKNAPSCKDPKKCLFSMSWTAWATNQFYHSCANVIIEGVAGGRLPALGMTVVDVPGYPSGMHAEGDKKAGKSTGPDRRERNLNLSGYFAYGGKAGTRGFNLAISKSKSR